MSYILGGKSFETATAVADYARIVLHRAVPGFAVEGEDAAFVADLFSHHPEARRKAGPGIAFFYVGTVPDWGTRNFLFFRSDGTYDNFSIKKCIESMKKQTRKPERLRPTGRDGRLHQPLKEKEYQHEQPRSRPR
ncbi:DCL family protein [Actinomyces sp. B33]|uniref:DCL family protein n=1 Tax=Actinomyces sp. B33 TaxID=2942131 RepID=UPI00233FD88E|nr:DCL family protein [Actinomyces sp. B33]MDC4232182.1 DCL family protein [Actinomyces sp. B33]